MSLIGRNLQTKAAPGPRDYPATAQRGANLQLINGRLVSYADNKITYLQKGYDLNDIVYAIVNKIADKVRLAPWEVFKVVDEQAYKQYKGMQAKTVWNATDYLKAANYQHKALERVKNPGKLGEILKWSNPEESMSDTVANGAIFEMLTGDQFLLANILRAGANSGLPAEIWLMPSQYTNIFSTDTFPSRVTGYNLTTVPAKMYTPSEVMHIKTFNPGYTVAGAQHYGVSPLRAALGTLNRNNSSMSASIASFQNEGVKGIAYMENQVGNVDGELAAAEVGKLAHTLRNEWSGEKNRGKIGLSGYTMGWLPIGLSSEEMQQIESEKWDMRRLCNVFGIQSQIMNDPENKTYSSQEEAGKDLISGAALPRLSRFRNSFNRHNQQYWGGTPGLIADYDMSVYGELQQDNKEMVEWLTPLMEKGLPLNRVLELLQLETINDPYYDLPRVTQSMGMTREEHDLNQVEQALNESDENTI